jgi:type IV secretory pathway TrbD component
VAAPVPVPVPAIPTPVVPPVVVPLPKVPKLPAPVLAAPVKTSAPAVSVPAVHAPLGGTSAGAATGSSSSPSSAGSSSGSSSSRHAARPNVRRLHSSRSWIGGTKRGTTLTFFLPRAARVFFTVRQVSPLCRATGHFSYRGHAGLNRVRFNGKLRGRQLDAGTYRISARARGGRTIPRVILVVVDGAAPTGAELAAARAANVCSAGAGAGSGAAGSTGASDGGSLASAQQLERSLQPKTQPLASGLAKGANSHSGVLAASLEKTAEAIRPVIVFLLGLAILLLAVAALPRTAVPDPRFHDVLARHRVDLAGVGAAALVAVVILFLFG